MCYDSLWNLRNDSNLLSITHLFRAFRAYDNLWQPTNYQNPLTNYQTLGRFNRRMSKPLAGEAQFGSSKMWQTAQLPTRDRWWLRDKSQPANHLGCDNHQWKTTISGWWFQIFFHFYPDPWWRWTQFDEHIFRMGLVQPPARLGMWHIIYIYIKPL